MVTTTATLEREDWLAANVRALLHVFAASVSTFLLLALLLHVCVRQQFAAHRAAKRESLDSLELTLVKSHTRAARLLALAGVVLQLVLAMQLRGNDDKDAPERAPLLFSLARPVVTTCVYFVGFMTNTHGAFRVLLLLLLSAVVVCDTIAEVQVAMVLDCRASQGLQCGSSGYVFAATDDAALRNLQMRDLLSLFVNPWLMLEVGYLCVSIGVCGSRFSRRQLSLSRPRFNVRAGLALYFPDQFGALTARSRRRAPRGSHSRVYGLDAAAAEHHHRTM